jgi:hypothetical protein
MWHVWGTIEKPYRLLVGKPEEHRRFWKPTLSWESNIRTCLKQTGQAGVDWSNLAQYMDKRRAAVNTVI